MKKIELDSVLKRDCLNVMKKIECGSIDLIYLDPPFFTEKKHSLKNKDRTKEFNFDDIWDSDKEYAKFLYERIEVMHSLLSESGSIFVHCDKKGEHIVRAILDRVFGIENFQSEIIWSYKRWSNSKKGLLPNHQNIYFYSKTRKFKFNTKFNDYSETTNLDQILQRRTRDKDNKSVYAKDENGEFLHGKEKHGVPLSDVWSIPYLNPKAKERVGYPTQKPLLLIERIIEIITDKQDVVLDPFCGSGTTCVAAKLSSRKFIGIDCSIDAVELSKARLNNSIKTESNLLKKGRESYQTANKEALSLLQGVQYNGIYRNKGIDAILVKYFEGCPVLVRVQKETESLSQALTLLAEAMKRKKSKKSFLIQTTNAELIADPIVMEGVHIIKSPATEISDLLNRFN